MIENGAFGDGIGMHNNVSLSKSRKTMRLIIGIVAFLSIIILITCIFCQLHYKHLTPPELFKDTQRIVLTAEKQNFEVECDSLLPLLALNDWRKHAWFSDYDGASIQLTISSTTTITVYDTGYAVAVYLAKSATYNVPDNLYAALSLYANSLKNNGSEAVIP